MPWLRLCCRALAVTLAAAAPVGAQSAPLSPRPFPTPIAKPSAPRALSRTPLSLFPVRTLWTIALNSRITQAPAYDDTRGYFAIDQHRIVAYDLSSGERQWIVAAAPQLPLVTGGGLLFVIEPEMVTALHAADGSVAWQLPFAEQLVVRPVWDNGWLIAATRANEILAFRASDGELIWRRTIGATAHAAPALAADRIYVPTDDGRIVALQVDTGAPLWERRVGGAVGEILPLEERVYAGSKDNDFYCLLTADGTIDWKWRTGADVIGAPVVDTRNVYFLALDNVLRALDRKSGGQRWKTSLPLRPTSGPSIANGTLIVSGLGPTMHGYNAKDGKAAGDIPVGADLAAPPYLAPHTLGGLPMVIAVTQDIAKGSTVSAITRAIEPALAPLAPLPGVIPMGPAAAKPTP
jgi:outer membrane protein assembly factor BamB